MTDGIVRSVTGRLSLRAPQAQSLTSLATALGAVPALRDHRARSPEELAAMVEALRIQFPMLSNFERDFPSLCFALATGVGKTRLMGAFIAYLHAAYGYRHFFVLAPNLTIYDKLIRDFTPNTAKYVFKGIAEFAVTVPEVVTGDNYEQRGSLSLLGGIEVNVFNISKINSEVRGGRAPRIKRLSEYLGQSYFDYLAALPDLVLLMDESHRYRAGAGVRALNELRPLLSLELTATPFTEAAGGPIWFKNIVVNYPLARAIEDGFVKEPAVVTQRNFDPSQYSAPQIERIKLMDGVRVHEETKVHLLTYAHQRGEAPVKPFMLVIARDTTHAAELLRLFSTELFDGRYATKVIQVDSSTTAGAEGDETVKRLLAVESYDEPTEIVIHVNMLKEGWDVTNLYTIVPLRAASARTLIEQSIGRGLRLPYGRKTGVEAVDRLNIIAHDRFQEVVDEAGRGDSPIRIKVLALDPASGASPLRSVVVTPLIDGLIGARAPDPRSTEDAKYTTVPSTTVLFTGDESVVARAALDAIGDLSRSAARLPTSAALAESAVQAEIVRRVMDRVTPAQADLLTADPAGSSRAVEDIVRRTTSAFIAHTIDIPRIQVLPKATVRTGYRPFALDVSRINFQPQDHQIISRGLQSEREIVIGASAGNRESRPEDYIVRELIGYDDVSYDEHADVLYGIAGQVVAHLRSYLKTDEDVDRVLDSQAKAIAANVHAQMSSHYFEDIGEHEVIVSQGFTTLKGSALTCDGEVRPLSAAPADGERIATLVYGNFTRCAYPVAKFHSDTERVLAMILERDARLWLRPVARQFNIFYRVGAEVSEYVPDFAVATENCNLLIETKRAADLDMADVRAKAEAASQWCAHASAHSTSHGALPWSYVLIPHDAVAVNRTLDALASTHTWPPARPTNSTASTS